MLFTSFFMIILSFVGHIIAAAVFVNLGHIYFDETSMSTFG